jgi:hypothetical protein
LPRYYLGVLPAHHAVAAAAVALPLALKGFDRRALGGFVAAAVLIDVDHYLGYIWETRDWSLVKAYAYHRGRYARPLRPFWQWRLRPHWPSLGFDRYRALHAVPVLIGLVVLARRWPALWPITLGVIFHRLQDEAWGYVRWW